MADIPEEARLTEGVYKLIRQYTVGHQRAKQGAKEIIAFIRPIIEKWAMERVFKWGNEPCPHEHLNSPMEWLRRMCPLCWQELLV